MMIPLLGLLDSVSATGGAAATAGTASAPPLAPAGTDTSFASLLGNAASNVIGSLTSAEKVSIQALQGNADTRQVVDAVMGAERSLQTAIAIRDKIVSAFLDVSRMSI